MATYHFSVNVGKKGRAASHAAYVVRAGDYSPALAGKRYEDIEYFEHGNMPAWAKNNPLDFWEASDKYERANGSTYREFEAALPRELTPLQRQALVTDFLQRAIGKSHAYTLGIHCPAAKLEGGEQPHVHLMYSERVLDEIERGPDTFFKRYNAKDPKKGGARKDSAGTKERLAELREMWATVTNEHLAKNGFDVTVDHRSNKDRGIEEEPEQHLGWWSTDEQRAAVIELRAAKNELKNIEKELKRLDLEAKEQEIFDERLIEQHEKHLAELAAQAVEFEKYEAEVQAQIDAYEAEQREDVQQTPLRAREKEMEAQIWADLKKTQEAPKTGLRAREAAMAAQIWADLQKPAVAPADELQQGAQRIALAVRNAARAQCCDEQTMFKQFEQLQEQDPLRAEERVQHWSSMSEDDVQRLAHERAEKLKMQAKAAEFERQLSKFTSAAPRKSQDRSDDCGLSM